MPSGDQAKKDQAALTVSDNLVQDMQGLLLRLHAACDLLKELLDRAEVVLGKARERISELAPELGGNMHDGKP